MPWRTHQTAMTELPLHSELTIWFICISLGLCFLTVAGGILAARSSKSLPPVPLFPGSSFPHHFAYFYTVFFMLTISMSTIAGIRYPEEAAQSRPDMIFSMLVQIALYVPFLCVYFLLPRRETPQNTLLTKVWWVAKALLIIWGASILLALCRFDAWLTELTGCPPMQDVVERMMNGDSFEKALMAVMAILVAPVTEECCFRGFVYNILKRWGGRWIATFVSSFLFAAIHGSLMQLLPLTIFAIVQCAAYEKARSLWLPVVIHTMFNACSTLVILFAPQFIQP